MNKLLLSLLGLILVLTVGCAKTDSQSVTQSSFKGNWALSNSAVPGSVKVEDSQVTVTIDGQATHLLYVVSGTTIQFTGVIQSDGNIQSPGNFKSMSRTDTKLILNYNGTAIEFDWAGSL